MINANRADILARLDAMLVQEATTTTRCCNYFARKRSSSSVDESCRKSMVMWLQQVRSTLNLSPDTVWIAMSIFDRYLCSGRGGSARALEDKCEFQLAAITAFYIAVKIHEPVVLGIDMLLVVCRHAYTENDFVSTEMDILSAIDWRVSCHTAIDYARSLLALIRDDQYIFGIADSLLGDCEKQMSDAIADIHLSCCKQSEMGIYCVAFSLAENKWLSLSEKEAVWARLSELCDVDLPLMGGAASLRYPALVHASPCKPNIVSRLGTSSQQQPAAVSMYSVAGSSTPVCISCTARKA